MSDPVWHPDVLLELSIDPNREHHPDLKCVSDSRRRLYTEERHRELDAEIVGEFTANHKLNELPDLKILLWCLTSNDDNLTALTGNRIKELLRDHPIFKRELEKAWTTRTFKNVRNLEILWPKLPHPTSDMRSTLLQSKATEYAWEKDFVGRTVESLKNHIQKCYNPKTNKVYAHYTAIVQSSGMGKSRLIDEFAKAHFVIRINLRGTSDGFPPPDANLRSFLVSSTDQENLYLRVYLFLLSLFEEATVIVDKLKGSLPKMDCTPERVSAEFRQFMTKGQTMAETGPDRQDFYDRIIKNTRLKEINFIGTDRNTTHESELFIRNLLSEVEKLRLAIECHSNLPTTQNFPIIFLEFDEVHLLTDKDKFKDDKKAINFSSELRDVLELMHQSPVFSFFLSTTGEISQPTPSCAVDSSTRIIDSTHHLIPPYMALGFDQAMKGREVSDGSHSIRQVADKGFMAHLGRPLFGTRYDATSSSVVRDDILKFAQLKLIRQDPSQAIPGLSPEQRVACLSVRLALEFNSTTSIAIIQERKQVEGHMRVCARVDEGSKSSMKTVSPSEPLLAEAAVKLMGRSFDFDAPEALKSVLENFSIDKGERGELLALLLLCLARDSALSKDIPERVVMVSSFMSSLFNVTAKVLTNWKPSVWTVHQTFGDAFEGSWIYFNHFIKVHEYKVINRKYLTAMIVRGAAVLCANCQSGVDAIIPFLYQNETIQRKSVGVIMVQVKNDPIYTDVPNLALFAKMDPYALGIFDDEHPAVPLIRIVFALASPKSALLQVQIDAKASSSRFTSYDFWSAGLSAEWLKPINKVQEDTWADLLRISRPWENLYMCSDLESDLRRSGNPATGVKESHWQNWFNFDDQD